MPLHSPGLPRHSYLVYSVKPCILEDMTKNLNTSHGINTLDVLEWADGQTSTFTNAQVYDAFPELEPNNLKVILHRYHRKGLIDKLARGLWAPKGFAQRKRPAEPHPVMPLTPGTQIHLVHEAIRGFGGPVTLSQLVRATGLAADSVSTHLARLKWGKRVSNPSRGVWVHNS